ncbi:hypothetical protein HQ496_06990 [bacterium]|nr:hypothetical protein [bacterium]
MERWYRHFLLVLAISTFCLIPAELALTGHTEGFFQLIPFVVSGLSLLMIGVWWFRKSSWSLWLTRVVMLVSCAASFLGVIKHFQHNLEFELEIRPGAVWTNVFMETISGASPLLAPGILFLAGVMVLAALHKWPSELN